MIKDQIRPDWESKLAAVRAAVARRANRRIVMRQVGDRLIPVGVTSGRIHALNSEEVAEAAEGGGSRRRRRHGGNSQLEQFMSIPGQDLEEVTSYALNTYAFDLIAFSLCSWKPCVFPSLNMKSNNERKRKRSGNKRKRMLLPPMLGDHHLKLVQAMYPGLKLSPGLVPRHWQHSPPTYPSNLHLKPLWRRHQLLSKAVNL